MPQTVTVSTDHLERIEQRLDSVETVIKRLLGVIEETTTSEKYTFNQLYKSDKFIKRFHEALNLYNQDDSQFVDPFKTYRE